MIKVKFFTDQVRPVQDQLVVRLSPCSGSLINRHICLMNPQDPVVPYKSSENPSNVAVDPMGKHRPLPLWPIGTALTFPLNSVDVPLAPWNTPDAPLYPLGPPWPKIAKNLECCQGNCRLLQSLPRVLFFQQLYNFDNDCGPQKRELWNDDVTFTDIPCFQERDYSLSERDCTFYLCFLPNNCQWIYQGRDWNEVRTKSWCSLSFQTIKNVRDN